MYTKFTIPVESLETLALPATWREQSRFGWLNSHLVLTFVSELALLTMPVGSVRTDKRFSIQQGWRRELTASCMEKSKYHAQRTRGAEDTRDSLDPDDTDVLNTLRPQCHLVRAWFAKRFTLWLILKTFKLEKGGGDRTNFWSKSQGGFI